MKEKPRPGCQYGSQAYIEVPFIPIEVEEVEVCSSFEIIPDASPSSPLVTSVWKPGFILLPGSLWGPKPHEGKGACHVKLTLDNLD